MLKHILLGFLNYRPMTGYELKSLMDESTMHFWHAYHSQIYTTLRKLEADGLVTSELDDGDDRLNRRTYTMTEAGIKDLRRWLSIPMDDISHPKEELLVRLFFSGDRDKAAVIDELRFQRQMHQRKLEQYQALTEATMREIIPDDRDKAAQQLPFWGATLRFGIEYERMYLKWIDETLDNFDK